MAQAPKPLLKFGKVGLRLPRYRKKWKAVLTGFVVRREKKGWDSNTTHDAIAIINLIFPCNVCSLTKLEGN